MTNQVVLIALSCFVHLNHLRDAREELSKASKREGSTASGEKDGNSNWMSRSRSDANASETNIEQVANEKSNKGVSRSIKKEKDLEVKDEGWQMDEIGALEKDELGEKDSEEVEEVEEVDNDDLDNALAEDAPGLALEA